MRIERTRLRDTPALAWIAAQAFAAGAGTVDLRRRAQGRYLMHLYSLALLVWGGRLWHGEKKAGIAIEHKKPLAWWKWLTPVGLCAVAVTALSSWISTADTAGLQGLLAIMKAGGGALIALLLLLLPAAIPALREMHPRRTARNAAAIRQWRATLPGREAYKVSYLAMYPQTRQGFVFARAAIERVVPAGLYTEARSEAHKAIYARRGFHRLPAADGAPTMAMGTS